MNRKSRYYHLLTVASIGFWLVIIVGCNSAIKKEKPQLFADYDFFSNQGVRELGPEDLNTYTHDKRPYVILKYKGNKLDSLILFNVLQTPYYIKTEKYNNNTIYELTVHDDIFGDMKSVLVFKDTVLVRYTILSQEPYVDSTFDGQITRIAKDGGSIIRGRIRQKDTTNFYHGLMLGDSLPIYQVTKVMPTQKRLTNELTLVSYLENKF